MVFYRHTRYQWRSQKFSKEEVHSSVPCSICKKKQWAGVVPLPTASFLPPLPIPPLPKFAVTSVGVILNQGEGLNSQPPSKSNTGSQSRHRMYIDPATNSVRRVCLHLHREWVSGGDMPLPSFKNIFMLLKWLILGKFLWLNWLISQWQAPTTRILDRYVQFCPFDLAS